MADDQPTSGGQTQEQERPEPTFASETERKVAEIFAEMLGLKVVSPEDDIFTLGGDSFEAVRIALELEYRFSVEFPIELLQTAGRVRDLAEWIDQQKSGEAAAEPRS